MNHHSFIRFNLIVSDSHEEKEINDTSCVPHYLRFNFTCVSEEDQEEYDDDDLAELLKSPKTQTTPVTIFSVYCHLAGATGA